jgi:gamma-glutamyltranspeptidase
MQDSYFPIPTSKNKSCRKSYLAVVDRWGNAVGELQSIQTMLGSCVIAGSTGILLNNRMTYWHLDPDHIDFLRPGQRVRHTMNPVMVFSESVENGGQLELVCGTPGADTQVQTNMQVVTGVFDYGLTVAEVIDGPRWTHNQAGTVSAYPHPNTDSLQIESRAGEEVIEGLAERGHSVELTGAWGGAGSEGAIQVDLENKTLFAASDPRREGDAQVW